MLITLFLFILGLALLIKGADVLIDGASSLARHLRISDFVIGMTVIAFGTSLPELTVNVIANIQGKADIALGNIVGSNIANILLILGIAATFTPLVVGKKTVWREIPYNLAAAGLLIILATNVFSKHTGIGRVDGIILLAGFALFLYSMLRPSQKTAEKTKAEKPKRTIAVATTFIIMGLFAVILGGKLIVDGAVSLARALGISEAVIALTIISVGTSLPELVTSAVAVFRHNHEIAMGNILGSNLFNILFILGISAVIRPLPGTQAFLPDLFIMLGATLLLFGTMFFGKKYVLKRRDGIIFLLLYATYIFFLIRR